MFVLKLSGIQIYIHSFQLENIIKIIKLKKIVMTFFYDIILKYVYAIYKVFYTFKPIKLHENKM